MNGPHPARLAPLLTAAVLGALVACGGGGGGSDADDPHALCISKINALRATKGLPALARWRSAEPCVDQQATADEADGVPHRAWSTNAYPACNGSGQNECLGGELTTCLDAMWSEKDQAGCAGCDACWDAYTPSCPGCDYFGTSTGQVCGHYVNMSAKYFTRAACGVSAAGGWYAINFD